MRPGTDTQTASPRCPRRLSNYPPQLKKRVASLVRGTEKSAHAFMVEAIAREAERAELRHKFIEEALAADREMECTGLAYDFDDIKEYFESKMSGQRARRPRLKRWRK